MNWDAVSATGEWAGAIAVVVTLIYLAIQIRQNNRGLRVNAYYQTADHITSTIVPIAQDPALSSIWNRGISRPDELSEEEWDRFVMLIIAYLHQNEAQYFAQQHGFHDEAIWRAKQFELATWVNRPGIQRVWETYKDHLSSDFVRTVEQLVEGRSGS